MSELWGGMEMHYISIVMAIMRPYVFIKTQKSLKVGEFCYK